MQANRHRIGAAGNGHHLAADSADSKTADLSLWP